VGREPRKDGGCDQGRKKGKEKVPEYQGREKKKSRVRHVTSLEHYETERKKKRGNSPTRKEKEKGKEKGK